MHKYPTVLVPNASINNQQDFVICTLCEVKKFYTKY